MFQKTFAPMVFFPKDVECYSRNIKIFLYLNNRNNIFWENAHRWSRLLDISWKFTRLLRKRIHLSRCTGVCEINARPSLSNLKPEIPWSPISMLTWWAFGVQWACKINARFKCLNFVAQSTLRVGERGKREPFYWQSSREWAFISQTPVWYT